MYSMSATAAASAPTSATPRRLRPPPKPKNLKFARALFAYQSQEPDELSFQEGDLLYVVDDTSSKDWWKARCGGKEGLVPANYLSTTSGGGSGDLSPLHDACRRGNVDLLEECLSNRAPVNVGDRAGNTPLHWAAHSGNADCLRRLLSLSGQIKTSLKNRLGDTPLHQAAYKGRTEIVAALREAGADFEAVNDDGQTAIELATDADTLAELRLWQNKLTGDWGVHPPQRQSSVGHEYGASDDNEDDDEG